MFCQIEFSKFPKMSKSSTSADHHSCAHFSPPRRSLVIALAAVVVASSVLVGCNGGDKFTSRKERMVQDEREWSMQRYVLSTLKVLCEYDGSKDYIVLWEQFQNESFLTMVSFTDNKRGSFASSSPQRNGR